MDEETLTRILYTIAVRVKSLSDWRDLTYYKVNPYEHRDDLDKAVEYLECRLKHRDKECEKILGGD